jgi:hypothetical protein
MSPRQFEEKTLGRTPGELGRSIAAPLQQLSIVATIVIK